MRQRVPSGRLTAPERVSVSAMTDASATSPIPTGPSSDSPARRSQRASTPDTTADEVLAGVLETAHTDTSVRPQDDLFRFVNGQWLATAEIPADRPSTGAFTTLRDEAEAACRRIVEELAEQFSSTAPEEASEVLATNRGRVGALYEAFMDETHLEELGAEPLAEELAPVLGASSKEELARTLGEMTPIGFMGVVGADVEVDINNPERYTSWMGQSGLGLPDESYYREEAQAPLRQAYMAHMARMLTLAGLTESFGASGEGLAERVMAVETALAKGHWDRVTCRDVEKMNNPMSWQQIVDSAPGLSWGRVARGGSARPPGPLASSRPPSRGGHRHPARLPPPRGRHLAGDRSGGPQGLGRLAHRSRTRHTPVRRLRGGELRLLRPHAAGDRRASGPLEARRRPGGVLPG